MFPFVYFCFLSILSGTDSFNLYEDQECRTFHEETIESSDDIKQGTLTTVDFRKRCPDDVVELFHLVGKEDERVQFKLEEMNLGWESMDSSAHSSCDHSDYIKISVYINNVKREISSICGWSKPSMLMSSNSRMNIEFVRRSVSNATGVAFVARYTFLTNFGILTGNQIFNKEGIDCMFEYFSNKTHKDGTFTSPNFPGKYPRNSKCYYIFHAAPNERVHISFPYFDVEGTSNCKDISQSDYVDFSNFHVHLEDRKMDRMCGNKSENTFKVLVSDGDYFRVTFVSNDLYDATGFNATYNFKVIENVVNEKPSSLRLNSTQNGIPQLSPCLPSFLFFLIFPSISLLFSFYSLSLFFGLF